MAKLAANRKKDLSEGYKERKRTSDRTQRQIQKNIGTALKLGDTERGKSLQDCKQFSPDVTGTECHILNTYILSSYQAIGFLVMWCFWYLFPFCKLLTVTKLVAGFLQSCLF